MDNDLTPINARPQRRPPEAVEDAALALREHLLWPVQDRLLELSDAGRAAVAGGAVVLALGIGIGGYSLIAGGSEQQSARLAAAVEKAAKPKPAAVEPKPEPAPTLQGATPALQAPEHESAGEIGGSKATEGDGATTFADTGSAATDTISSDPAARPATASASSAATVDGPPAGPAAVAVARKFADAFVVYETGGNPDAVRRAFAATATPALRKALLQRPPRQPAGIEVPQAKVLNVVPAPSQGEVYPLSVSLLRVGTTSELRLEMEQLKNNGWRVVDVLG